MPSPDFAAWFASQISEENFTRRREPHLQHDAYLELFNEHLAGIEMVTSELPRYRDQARKSGMMTSTRRRLWSTLDWLSLQYSAGAPVSLLAEVWPHAMDWAEEYAAQHKAYHQSPENRSGDITPHVALVSEEYWIVALRLVCFGLLTGHAQHMPRVMALLDYANAELGIHDGLIERLVAPWVPDRPIPDKATRHLPYRKLFKVFAATPDKRPALMGKYLDEWYHASRREPYIDQHQGSGMNFYGYWAWEAAATTWVLGMDDSSYRDMPFYPKDLADFARLPTIGTPHTRIPPHGIPGGHPCPQTGWWYSPANTQSRRYFQQDEIFPILNSDYGATFWIWSQEQTPT